MAVTRSHVRVRVPHDHRHRSNVDQPQHDEFSHETLEVDPDLAIGVDGPSQEHQSQDYAETDEDASPHTVKQMVPVMLVPQLCDHRDYDVDEGQAADCIELELPSGRKISKCLP